MNRVFGVGLLILVAGAQSWAQAPAISKGGVVPLYSSSSTIQSGEWVSIYGTNLVAPGTPSTPVNSNFPPSLGGTTVTIDGKPALLYYVSSGLIDLLAPADTATGSVSVAVTTSAGTSTATVTLAQVAPSFFLLDSKHVTGIILRVTNGAVSGYDYIGPTGNSLGFASVAARPGDIVELFATGLGPTTPSVTAGQGAAVAAPTNNAVKLLINNVSVTPSYAGLSTQAGVYQINFTVPAGLGTGDVPLVATVGGAQSPSNVVISLQTTTEIKSLTLSANAAASGGTVTGTVTLYAAAPSGGEVVTLSGSSGTASFPATVYVPAGASSATFTISAGTVSSSQPVTVTASYGEDSVQASLTVIPCATIGGSWNATESGSLNTTLDAAGQVASAPTPFFASGGVTFTQSGCSIQLNPIGQGELLGTTSNLSRSGTVTGNSVTLTGQVASLSSVVAAEEAAISGLIVTSSSENTNQMTASGTVSGNVLTLNESGTFSASGGFSFQGQGGSFTITITSSSSATFNYASGTRPADRTANAAASSRSVEVHVMPDSPAKVQGSVTALLRAAFMKALRF